MSLFWTVIKSSGAVLRNISSKAGIDFGTKQILRQHTSNRKLQLIKYRSKRLEELRIPVYLRKHGCIDPSPQLGKMPL